MKFIVNLIIILSNNDNIPNIIICGRENYVILDTLLNIFISSTFGNNFIETLKLIRMKIKSSKKYSKSKSVMKTLAEGESVEEEKSKMSGEQHSSSALTATYESKKDFTVHSNSHCTVWNPVGTSEDKVVLEELMNREVSKITFSDLLKRNISSTTDKFKDKSFHLVSILELDQLSQSCQSMLKKYMEKCVKTQRFVCLTNKISSIIEPLKSMCLVITIPTPSHEQIHRIICQTINYPFIKIDKNDNIDDTILSMLYETKKNDIKIFKSMEQLVNNIFKPPSRYYLISAETIRKEISHILTSGININDLLKYLVSSILDRVEHLPLKEIRKITKSASKSAVLIAGAYANGSYIERFVFDIMEIISV